MPNVQVPVVVGSNRAEALICTAIPLPLPALEIVDIRKTVIIDSCKVMQTPRRDHPLYSSPVAT